MHAAQMADELSQRERALRRLPLPYSLALRLRDVGVAADVICQYVNVERDDLSPDPEIPKLASTLGKGYLLPAPVLPRASGFENPPEVGYVRLERRDGTRWRLAPPEPIDHAVDGDYPAALHQQQGQDRSLQRPAQIRPGPVYLRFERPEDPDPAVMGSS